MSDIIEKADKLVNVERQEYYGHPIHDFSRTSGMLSSLGFRFVDHDGNLRKLDATDIPIIMMCVKLSREVNKHKEDNVLDMTGYAKTLDMVYEYRKEKADKEAFLNCPKAIR